MRLHDADGALRVSDRFDTADWPVDEETPLLISAPLQRQHLLRALTILLHTMHGGFAHRDRMLGRALAFLVGDVAHFETGRHAALPRGIRDLRLRRIESPLDDVSPGVEPAVSTLTNDRGHGAEHDRHATSLVERDDAA